MKNERKKIKKLLITFIVFLALSGITAFPIKTEIIFLNTIKDSFPDFITNWIAELYTTINNTPDIMLYGTDWLAFAHLVIAVAFIGPLRDPVKNIWVIQFGMIACMMIFPLALICGPIRGIPLFHQLIDCSFGILGIIPLSICYKKIKIIEKTLSISTPLDITAK